MKFVSEYVLRGRGIATILRALLVGWAVLPPVLMADDAADDQSAEATAEDDTKDEAGSGGQPSAAEIAAELSNPNTTMGSMTFNSDYTAYDGDLPGAGSQYALRTTFQPVLPYPLAQGLNLFVRPAIPVVWKQDVPTANGYDNPGFNLGDTGFDVAIGKSFPSGLVLLGGMLGTIPTATDDALGNDVWALGPEAGIAIAKKWGVLGMLVGHQWDVAGSSNSDVDLTSGQLFYTFNLKDGWQISASPTWSYNHDAAPGQEWTVPVGIGMKKTTFLGSRAWKFGLEYWHYVEQNGAFGPDFQIRFSITPVVALPW